MINFIQDMDKLSCAAAGADFPQSCIDNAREIQSCIDCGKTPETIRYAFFKVTPTCNSDCAYCEHAYSRSKDKEQITLAELESVIKQLGDMGVTACSLSGGEPLVYKHVNAAVELLIQNKIQPVLLTNGILLPEKIESLYKSGLRYVIMSLDSFQPEHYKKTRGVDFEQVMRAYKFMVNFKNAHSDFIFRITTVISRENADDIPRLCETAESDGVGVQFTPYHNFINKQNDYGVRDIQKADELAKTLTALKNQGKTVCNSAEYLSYFPEFFRGPRAPEGYKCKCGFQAVYIWHNLDVRACWSTTLPAAGNLRERTLSEIWNGERYRALREKMLARRCEGCWLLCTAEFNILHDKYLQGETK